MRLVIELAITNNVQVMSDISRITFVVGQTV